jgi:DNA-binding XRE family transcriptional regulator
LHTTEYYYIFVKKNSTIEMSKDYRAAVGRYLCSRRTELGYSMQSVSAATGVSATTIYKMENNSINFRINTLITLLQHYSSMDKLVGFDAYLE